MKRLALPLLALLLAAGAAWWLLSSTPQRTTPDTPPISESGEPGGRDPNLLEGNRVDPEAGPTTAARPSPRLSAALLGRVERSDGTPIPNARVQAALVNPQRLRGAPFADAPAFATTTSDDEGAFELDAPARGFMTVTASASGFATQSVRVASRAVFVRIRLARAGALTVHVRDARGAALPLASVEVMVGGTRHVAGTLDAGEASFDALAPGTARLQAFAPEHAKVSAPPVRIVPGQNADTTIVLPVAVRVVGTVVDAADGAPIGGASVFVSRPGASEDAGLTTAQGQFDEVPGGGPGERQFLSVEADGYAPALEPFVLQVQPDGTAQSVVVRLQRAKPWRGRVLGAGGKPAANVRVGFTADGVAGREPQVTRSDEGGWFTLPPPRPPVPGRRLVLAADSAAGRAARVFRAGDVAPSPLVLQLVSDTSVYGRVRDRDGAPLAGGQVRLLPVFDRSRRAGTSEPHLARRAWANETGFSTWATATGEDGTWRVDQVVPGTYRVQVRAGTHVVWMPETIDVEGGDVNAGVWRLASGSGLSGVVRSRDGEPLAGAFVRLIADTSDFRPASVTASEDGAYSFDDVPPGAYRVDAHLQGFHMTDAESVQLGDDGNERLDLTLHAGAQLAIRLDDAQGPWRGTLSVRLHRPGRARAALAPYSVRMVAGRALLSGLPPGTFAIEARAPDLLARSTAPVSLRLGGNSEVHLVAERPGSVQGSVVTQAGAPSAGARVHLVAGDTGLRLLATTDADGRFRIAGVPPGSYDLTTYGPGGAPAADRVDVSAGEAAKVKLLLRPSGSADVRIVGPDGRGASNVRLTFRATGRLIRGLRPDRSGPGGRLRRDGLPTGFITVHARADDGRVGVGELDVARDRVTPVVVVLRKLSEEGE